MNDNIHPIFNDIFRTIHPKGTFKEIPDHDCHLSPMDSCDCQEWTPEEREEAYDKFYDEEENRATGN